MAFASLPLVACAVRVAPVVYDRSKYGAISRIGIIQPPSTFRVAISNWNLALNFAAAAGEDNAYGRELSRLLGPVEMRCYEKFRDELAANLARESIQSSHAPYKQGDDLSSLYRSGYPLYLISRVDVGFARDSKGIGPGGLSYSTLRTPQGEIIWNKLLGVDPSPIAISTTDRVSSSVMRFQDLNDIKSRKEEAASGLIQVAGMLADAVVNRLLMDTQSKRPG